MVTYKGTEYVYYDNVNGEHLFYIPVCDVVLKNNDGTITYTLAPGEAINQSDKVTELGMECAFEHLVTPNDCY